MLLILLKNVFCIARVKHAALSAVSVFVWLLELNIGLLKKQLLILM